MPVNLDLLFFNAGGGHRAAAMALEAIAQQQARPWRLRRVNLFEVLDPEDRFRRITGMAPEELYNKRLSKGWTLGLSQELKLLQGLIRMGHPSMMRRLQQHWLHSDPDMIVSLVPNFNRVMRQSAAATLPGVPYVTVMTDMADHPPHFWIEPGDGQHLICGTDKAAAQARAAGVPEHCIHASSGMIIRPDFYHPVQLDRSAVCQHLGLDPSRPIGLVMFGGEGSMAMLDIAQRLSGVQLILVCGRHPTLQRELQDLARQKTSAARAVVGFTNEVRKYMMLADFFIGKPGPGCLSEALQQGLPVITFRNAWTMPQERYNTDWVLEKGLGLVIRSTRRLDAAVGELLSKLDDYKSRVRCLDNRAIHEVPEILARILADSHHAGAPMAVGALSFRAGSIKPA